MGAWGINNFDNDGAMDFSSDVVEGDRSFIKDAILKVTNTGDDDYLEAPDCENALAAIEFIAAQKGKPSPDFPEEAQAWIKNNDLLNFTSGLFRKRIDITGISLQAIERIGSNSELQELWEEGDEYEDWLKVLEDLKNRIK
ncbi:MAG: hypothetical protein K0S44_292 [Bacteroidetes bacterium]|jgi:hypothetical protein|nr:hypothetical protein [Bacteroidota bacterium]